MAGTDDRLEATPGTGGWSSLLFLLGLVAFLASLVAYGADLVTGYAVGRSAAVNAAAALGLVAWAARDTLTDPESAVDSRGGAASTALMLYGLYLALASVVVGATSPWHGRLSLALVAAAGGIAALVVGFLGFPRERVLDGEETGGDAETPSESAVGAPEEPSTDDPRE